MQIIRLRTEQKNIILGILFLTWVLVSFNKIAITIAIIPMTEEFNLTPYQIGLIMSSFFFSYAAVSLIAGFVTNKAIHRSIMTKIMILWTGLAMATAAAWNFICLMVLRSMHGAAGGMLGPLGAVTIAELFPKEERGRAQSFLVSGTVLGTGVGGLVTAAIIAMFHWRMAFLLFGILGAIFTILFCILIGDHMINMAAAVQPDNTTSITKVIQEPFVLKLGLIALGAGTVNWGLTSWLPGYWVNIQGMSMVNMGVLTVVPAIIMFVFMQISGVVLDKLMVKFEKYVLFCSTLCVAALMYLMMGAVDLPGVVAYLSLTFVMMAFITSTMFVLPQKYLPTRMIGSATGFIIFMHLIAGSIAPAVMGFLITKHSGSYSPVFLFVGIMILMSAAVSLTINTKVDFLKSEERAGRIIRSL
ncbi:MAG: hypothetical protein CVU54_13155 [Deltaproteobacteria bacterium HGW-Deltaproteobacteria-12]|jgi:MFS family permease|nr:MAG: hypothetical protein CVU54_13155 [Deltaproteobacteria bacterium HGW-Deltaproteobacteria-12]